MHVRERLNELGKMNEGWTHLKIKQKKKNINNKQWLKNGIELKYNQITPIWINSCSPHTKLLR